MATEGRKTVGREVVSVVAPCPLREFTVGLKVLEPLLGIRLKRDLRIFCRRSPTGLPYHPGEDIFRVCSRLRRCASASAVRVPIVDFPRAAVLPLTNLGRHCFPR